MPQKDKIKPSLSPSVPLFRSRNCELWPPYERKCIQRVLRIAFANWTLLFDSENTLTNYTSVGFVYLFSAAYQYMNAMSVLFVANYYYPLQFS